MQDFRLFVRCFTYRQAQYIRQTMDGFTIQRTGFPFVCCIVDDASDDGAPEVIRQYLRENFEEAAERDDECAAILTARHKTNPDCHFVAVFLKTNMFREPQKKFDLISEWRLPCEYEALCEGDDWWTDPFKLRDQAAYLDAHPECGLCYTRARVYDQKKQAFTGKTFGRAGATFESLLEQNTIPTLTTVMRRQMVDDYREEIRPQERQWKMGDHPMWLWFAHNGHLWCIDRETCVYRKLSESASHHGDLARSYEFFQSGMSIIRFFADRYGYPLDERKIQNKTARIFCRRCLDDGEFGQAKQFAAQIDPLTADERMLKTIMRSGFLTRIYAAFRKIAHPK